MASLVDLLGESVITSKHETVCTSDLMRDGGVVGLYFSGISPSGQAFTSLLSSFYKSLKNRNGDTLKLEIVFVSTGEEEELFKKCLNDMTWLAVPFSKHELRLKLLQKYRVSSLPALVLLDASSCRVITLDGRTELSQDLDGKDFPWYKKSLSELLKGPLLKGESLKDSEQCLPEKIFKAFYFSAHWFFMDSYKTLFKVCLRSYTFDHHVASFLANPSPQHAKLKPYLSFSSTNYSVYVKVFTPILKDVYERVQKSGQRFEIVFVSSDRSEVSFQQYYEIMPWLAVPYLDPRIKHLTRHFNVLGIPCLVMVDENNEVLNSNCRADVMKDQQALNFPWPLELVEELNEETSAALNSTACLILFTDGDKSIIDSARELLRDSAEKYCTEQKASRDSEQELPELKFLFEGIQSEEVADSVRAMTQLEGREPLLAIIDPLTTSTLCSTPGDVSSQALHKLISDFKKFYQQSSDDLFLASENGLTNLTIS